MSLAHAILGVVEARPMNGYELARFFDAHAGWVWSAPRSQIYPQLRNMEDAGLITAERQVRGERLERRVYSITAAGAAELREWVSTPFDTRSKRDALLLQALYFDVVDPTVAVAVLRNVIDEQAAIARSWASHADQLRRHNTPLLKERLKRRPPTEHERIARIKAHVFDAGTALAQARIAWAEEGIRILTAGPDDAIAAE
ncbi:PadR family transcriptional regulator [Kribbella kalugense]|uniref:PadR family transcriptional regulator n=1 Tax=Kribbella kalugense TaxID=2512221 RepID=A0A4R8A1B5_9ACTN|nr:PadR family transcriptional regulator [Kribbella kalugense]TDW24202.1 PadR family transcriptional regulator [Kribbella kalugense]